MAAANEPVPLNSESMIPLSSSPSCKAKMTGAVRFPLGLVRLHGNKTGAAIIPGGDRVDPGASPDPGGSRSR